MYQHDRGYNFGRGVIIFVSSIKGVLFLLSSIRGGIIFEQVYTFINSLTKSMSNTFSDIFDAIFFLFAVSSNFCSAIHGSINSFL